MSKIEDPHTKNIKDRYWRINCNKNFKLFKEASSFEEEKPLLSALWTFALTERDWLIEGKPHGEAIVNLLKTKINGTRVIEEKTYYARTLETIASHDQCPLQTSKKALKALVDAGDQTANVKDAIEIYNVHVFHAEQFGSRSRADWNPALQKIIPKLGNDNSRIEYTNLVNKFAITSKTITDETKAVALEQLVNLELKNKDMLNSFLQESAERKVLILKEKASNVNTQSVLISLLQKGIK